MHKFMTFYTLDFLEGRMESKVVLIYFLQYIPDAYIFFCSSEKNISFNSLTRHNAKIKFPTKEPPTYKVISTYTYI